MTNEIVILIIMVCVAALAVANIAYGVRIMKLEHEIFEDENEPARHKRGE